MEKKQKRSSKNQNLNDICYFCKKPLINSRDWCYIEKEGLKTKAHYKCIAENPF
jgi:hypothetical protein